MRNEENEKRKTKEIKEEKKLVFSPRQEGCLQLRGEGGERRGLFHRFFDAQTSHRDTLPVVGGRELRLSRLYRIQCGCKLIGPELLAVSHLAVPLRLLRGRSTWRSQTLRQQLDQIRRMRLVPQY